MLPEKYLETKIKGCKKEMNEDTLTPRHFAYLDGKLEEWKTIKETNDPNEILNQWIAMWHESTDKLMEKYRKEFPEASEEEQRCMTFTDIGHYDAICEYLADAHILTVDTVMRLVQVQPRGRDSV